MRQETINQGEVFLGNVPIRTDVLLLAYTFQDMSEGALITHEQIEEVLGINRNSNRYRSVVAAWKEEQFDGHNIFLISARSVGYQIANPDERIQYCQSQKKKGAKCFAKIHEIAQKTDINRLSTEHRKELYLLLTDVSSRLRQLENLKEAAKIAVKKPAVRKSDRIHCITKMSVPPSSTPVPAPAVSTIQ